MTTSPPQSSGQQPAIGNCCLIRSSCASGLSILLIATMIGTFAALRVIDGFDRLRHHAVVRRHHQNDDVRDLGAAGTHAGERFVARRINEHNLAGRSCPPRDTRRCAA